MVEKFNDICIGNTKQELSLLGAKVLGMELLFSVAKVPWNFRSREQKS